MAVQPDKVMKVLSLAVGLILVWLTTDAISDTMPIRPPDPRAKIIRDQTDIDRVLRLFKAAQHISLPALLKQYGLTVTRVDVVPIDLLFVHKPNDRDGDLLVTIVADGVATKKLPCNLREWLNPGNTTRSTLEITQRDGKFLVDRDGDKFLYWAATGRCRAE